MPEPSVLRQPSSNRAGLESFAGIVDFSLGAWSARAAARQLAQQLGTTLETADRSGPDLGNIIAQGVDKEAAGPLRIVEAYSDARRIAGSLGPAGQLLVLSPRYACCRDDEPDPFLEFLGRFGIRVTQTRNPDLPPPPDVTGMSPGVRALLAFFPGPLPTALIASAGLAQRPDLFADPRRGIIHPALRDSDPSKSPGRMAALAPYVAGNTQAAIMYNLFGPAFYAERPVLIEAGLNLFQRGEFARGKRIMERARAISPTATEKAICDLHIQGYRIFEHRFAEAAAVPVPAPDLPAELGDKLRLTIAWGRIFNRQAEDGLAMLEPYVADVLKRPHWSTDDLFLLNIAALGCLRTGQSERAYNLEKDIETRLMAEAAPDQRAKFINALNLARLHRGRADPAAYSEYLERAFATSAGLRNLSEMLQLNLMRSKYGKGERHAGMYLLRAALIWLSLDPPQSLSIRARQTLTFEEIPFDLIDAKISGLIHEMLAEHWPDALSGDETATFTFATVDSSDVPEGAIAVGQHQLCLVVAPHKPHSSPMPAERQRLAGTVTRILRQVFTHLQTTGQARILLNLDVGQDIPQGRPGLLTMMARCGLRNGVWNDEEFTLPRTCALLVGLAPGVRHIRKNVVTFQRSRPSARLTDIQARLVQEIGGGPELLKTLAKSIGHEPRALLSMCRDLERNHIVKFEVQNA